MTINDFCKEFAASDDFKKQSRLLVIRNNQEAINLLADLNTCVRKDILEKVRISDCITTNQFLPAAPKLLLSLKERIQAVNQKGKIAFVVGFNEIMQLWSNTSKMEAFRQIHSMLDNADLRFLIFTDSLLDLMNREFTHPRYQENRIILQLEVHDSRERPTKSVRLISDYLPTQEIAGATFDCFQEFVREGEDGILTAENANIKVNASEKPLAGISETIEQIFTQKKYLQEFHQLKDELSEQAVQWLFTQLQSKSENALIFAQNHFLPNGLDEALVTAPKQMYGFSQVEKEVFIWTLKSSLQKGSYLHYVLFDQDFTTENFFDLYVCEAIKLLDAPDRKRLAAERQRALGTLGTDYVNGSLSNFMRQIREYSSLDEVAVWLNLKTDPERHELMRRITGLGPAGIPKSILEVYPQLDAYLQEYPFDSDNLNCYFSEYRNLKIRNTVTAEFCEKAKDVTYPPIGITSRDSLLQSYRNEPDTALLIVDGLGAEYLPMLLHLAKTKQLNVQTATVAYSNLPTSTAFNPISWPGECLLPEIKVVDNIIHNGEEAHTTKTFEENFVALLNAIDQRVMSEVAKGLSIHSKIILTSDHGSSRLAVLAKQQGLSKTIPLSQSPAIDDWRYMKKHSGIPMDKALTENISGDYWIVKGYDRLPKNGPKLNELHGGATYEEFLVPFIVFQAGTVFASKGNAENTNSAEFEENSDFDL